MEYKISQGAANAEVVQEHFEPQKEHSAGTAACQQRTLKVSSSEEGEWHNFASIATCTTVKLALLTFFHL